MSAAAKGVVGVAIPVVGAGGVYMCLGKVDNSMPQNYITIESPTTGKAGADYQYYWVDKENSGNEDWWKWSYEKRFLPVKGATSTTSGDNVLSDEFKDISSKDALKDACHTAYTTKTDTELTDKYKRDVWRFCSIFSEKPKTIEDNATTTDKENLDTSKGKYNGKFGASKKTELVSVTDTSDVNKKFWEIREKEFFGENGKTALGIHSKSNESEKNLFDRFFDSKDKRTESLKSKCAEAYEMDSTSAESGKPKKPEVNDVVKFCGLKKSS